MSQWTHVAVVIRFDSLRLDEKTEEHFKPDLGFTCTFNSPQSDWHLCNVPCGSEGSLQHYTWENPERHQLASYSCMIWGDLRDYNNVNEIITYLNRVVKGKLVRQIGGVIEVESDSTVQVVSRIGLNGETEIVALNLADM